MPSLWCLSILIRVVFHLSFLARCRVNVIGLLFFATVFSYASVFNEDLTQWDVAKVTNMNESKSISILEKDLAEREFLQ